MHRFLPYARLVRLPNVFTAMADVALAALACAAMQPRTQQDGLSLHGAAFLWLLLASSCLYCSGMVWNDVFDLQEDRKERPFRPLPSGQISVQTAMFLGAILMLAGLAAALMADQALGVSWHASLIAVLLVAAIFLYDGFLKRTPLGPVGMGVCRFLNIHLGLAAAGAWPDFWGWALALVVGLYIVGVTWFAFTETARSNPLMLTVGASLMLAALLIALTLPPLLQFVKGAHEPAWLFPYLLVAFGFFLGAAVIRALRRPSAENVQAAVKRAILGLIVLDATLATAFVGILGLLLALLLVPAQVLGRWVYST